MKLEIVLNYNLVLINLKRISSKEQDKLQLLIRLWMDRNPNYEGFF